MLYDFQEILEMVLGSTSDTIPIPYKKPVIRAPRGVGETYYKNLNECVELLQLDFQLKERSLSGYVKAFAVPENPKKLTALHSYHVSCGQQHCFWTTMTFREVVRRDGRYPKQEEFDALRQAAIVDVPFNAGNVLMRPEGLQDKIIELFGNIDIDFEDHSLFSRKYFVMSDDEKRVRDKMPQSFRELFANNPGYIVRLQNKKILISRDSAIRAATSKSLVELAFAVAECR